MTVEERLEYLESYTEVQHKQIQNLSKQIDVVMNMYKNLTKLLEIHRERIRRLENNSSDQSIDSFDSITKTAEEI